MMNNDETCEKCGFDSGLWNNQDTVNTVRQLGDMARLAVAGASAEVLATRPDTETWTIGEYVDGIEIESDILWARLDKVSGEQWDQEVAFGGASQSITWFSRHAVHDCFHHLATVAAIRHALGDVGEMDGILDQISVSSGGCQRLRSKPASSVGSALQATHQKLASTMVDRGKQFVCTRRKWSGRFNTKATRSRPDQ